MAASSLTPDVTLCFSHPAAGLPAHAGGCIPTGQAESLPPPESSVIRGVARPAAFRCWASLVIRRVFVKLRVKVQPGVRSRCGGCRGSSFKSTVRFFFYKKVRSDRIDMT